MLSSAASCVVSLSLIQLILLSAKKVLFSSYLHTASLVPLTQRCDMQTQCGVDCRWEQPQSPKTCNPGSAVSVGTVYDDQMEIANFCQNTTE